jgi:hypothetical protein
MSSKSDIEMKSIVPTLDGTNFTLWTTQMISYLQSKGLYKFVTKRGEALKKSAEREKNTDKLETLLDCDEKALGLIKCNIADSFNEILVECTTALEAWTNLETYFAGKEQFNRINLLQQLIDGKLSESDNPTTDIQEFIREKNELVRRLNAAGLKISDELQVAIMLARLPDSYDVLRRIMEAQSSLTVLKLCSELTKEGVRRGSKRKLSAESSSDSAPASAYSAQGSSSSSPPFKRTKVEGKRKLCNFCDVKGHEDSKCWFNPKSTSFRPEFREKLIKAIKNSNE